MLLMEVQQSDPESILNSFKHKDAAKYGKSMVEKIGNPAGATPGMLYWKSIDGMNDIYLKDESIEHDFPGKHRDFVYSSQTIDVPSHMHDLFAHVTGSIIIDGLKKQVTARCGALLANAITLQFVKDVVSSKAPQDFGEAKEEYAARINKWKSPSWFKNTMKD